MSIKLKPINKHIVNGSTLMGFGITVILLTLEVWETTQGKIMLVWGITGGLWFLFLGVYEILISVTTHKLFEEQ